MVTTIMQEAICQKKGEKGLRQSQHAGSRADPDRVCRLLPNWKKREALKEEKSYLAVS